MPKILGILSLTKNSTIFEAYIPSCSIRHKPVSLAYKCKLIVIITHICVIINKLIKISSIILYSPSNITASAFIPTIMLLHWVHFILQLLGHLSQKFNLLVHSSHLEREFDVWCRWFVVFRNPLKSAKLWWIAQNISSHLSYFT
jgi:hypothetical protein